MVSVQADAFFTHCLTSREAKEELLAIYSAPQETPS